MATFHQLQCMRSFVAVAEAGSFSRAADALQIGAASVSEHIASLERHLGVSLLQRTTRFMRLTHEGTNYLAMCHDVLDRIAQGERQLAGGSSASALAGLLTIEMSDGVDAFLLPAVQAFQEIHPDVEIHILRTSHQFDGLPGGADLAIRSVAPPRQNDRHVVSRVLGLSRTIFLAAPSYLARHGAPNQPKALMTHRCIGYVDPLTGRLWEWYFMRGGTNPFTLDISCRLAMTQGELRRRAAADGLGIINDLAHFTKSWVEDGSLVPLLEQWTMAQPICHLLYHRDRHRAPRTATFIAHLEQWLADIDQPDTALNRSSTDPTP